MRKLRQSQIVNNFFTLASIIMVCVVLVLYVKYIAKDDTNNLKENVETLECEKEVLTISKVYNQNLLNKSQKYLNKGSYKLNGKKLDSFFVDSIDSISQENEKAYLNIDYKVLTKDESKIEKIKRDYFYEASILVRFRSENKDIFKILTDFKVYNEDSIKERINCIIKVYKNNVRKIK